MDEDTEANRFFDELMAAVTQQLEARETQYVRKAFERLMTEGLSQEEAIEAIARCLAEETDTMFRSKRPFDTDSYRKSLERIKPEP